MSVYLKNNSVLTSYDNLLFYLQLVLLSDLKSAILKTYKSTKSDELSNCNFPEVLILWHAAGATNKINDANIKVLITVWKELVYSRVRKYYYVLKITM